MNKAQNDLYHEEKIAFRELTESSVPNYGSELKQDSISAVNTSNVNFEESDLNTSFRSIQAGDMAVGVSMMPISDSELDVYSSQKSWDAHRSLASETHNESMSLSKPDVVVERCQLDRSDVVVPKKPIYVSKCHVSSSLPLLRLLSRVEGSLDKFPEIAHSFNSKECKWDAVYLRGSCRCHFEICVYGENEDETSPFIVEGNRLSGDCMIFRSLFGAVKQVLSSTFSGHTIAEQLPCGQQDPSPDFTMPISSLDDLPLPMCQELSASATSDALKPIVDMARSHQVDAKIEAARILCDISLRHDLHRVMCDSGCIQALIDLSTVDHEWCNQHAICALANMSTSRPCQDVLLASPTLFSALMRLAVDGPHCSVEMRRECARTLANLCAGFGPRVVSAVGADVAANWVNSVEAMRDSRLKLHAERAKASLLPALHCV